jgi:hypothetical protein
VTENILDHLRLGVFNKLQELDASFYNASLESVREMTRITPNLKKIGIRAFSGDNQCVAGKFGKLSKLGIDEFDEDFIRRLGDSNRKNLSESPIYQCLWQFRWRHRAAHENIPEP